MYYLIKETLGRKRCIARNESDVYKDNQFYDCLNSYPFDPANLILVRKIHVRCIASPGKITDAGIYTDSPKTFSQG